MTRVMVSAVVATIAMASSCSAGGEVAGPTTTVGSELFELRAIGSEPGCVTCHSLTPDVVLVGPSLADVGARAASTLPDLDAAGYLRQSIIDPQAHIAYEATSDMPKRYAELLSAQQVEAIVAYLLEVSS